MDELIKLQTFIKNTDQRQKFLERLKEASREGAPKLRLQSCLAQPGTALVCAKSYDPKEPQELADFIQQLHAFLGKLACESPEIARGLIKQIPKDVPDSSSRKGLEVVLKKSLDEKCAGLQGLSPEDKKSLQAIK